MATKDTVGDNFQKQTCQTRQRYIELSTISTVRVAATHLHIIIIIVIAENSQWPVGSLPLIV